MCDCTQCGAFVRCDNPGCTNSICPACAELQDDTCPCGTVDCQDATCALFWPKVAVRGPDECWEWKGFRNTYGYGRLSLAPKYRDKTMAHRVSYELAVDAIPPGMFVLHKCDNRGCVNPGHLFLGTLGDNNRDRDAKGRTAHGETNGKSKLTATLASQIRAASGSIRDIASRFGVHHGTVQAIKNGTTWREEVEDAAAVPDPDPAEECMQFDGSGRR